jgi:hypothetical protein
MWASSMRRGLLCTFGLAAALAGPVHAGWKITTQTSTASYRSVVTEYFSGGLQRTDYADPHGQRQVTVLDFDHARRTIWNVDSKEYMVVPLNRRPDPLPLSQKITVIDQATTDTGERRTIFGRTARHLVTRETQTDGSVKSERRTDGWYVDSDTLPREKRAGSGPLLSSGKTMPNIKMNHSGPALTGLAVWQKITIASSGQTHEWTIDVTELVEGPLSKDLFEPPKSFRRVTSFPGDHPLSWTQQIQRGWEWIEDLVSGVGD